MSALPPYASPGQKIWYYSFRTLCGLIFFFLIFPIVVIIPLSFNAEDFFTFTKEMLAFEPAGYSLKHYRDFLTNPDWQQALRNSVTIAPVATLLATGFGTLAAIGLSQSHVPFRSAIMAILISPMIVPLIISAAGMYFFYSRIGLQGTYWGVVPSDLGVRHMVHFGAYPFAVPHTRNPRLSVSSPSQDVLAHVPFLRSSIDVPAGVAAALEREMHERGIPALGIWAQVPHYISAMSYPAASVALLDGLRDATGVVIDGTDLRSEVLSQGRRLDAMISGNDEHAKMIEQLEQIYDASDDTFGVIDGGPSLEMRSGDELAEELEQFLRDQD